MERGLRILDAAGLPDATIEQAHAAGIASAAADRVLAAAEATTGEVLPASGDRKSEQSECKLHPDRSASSRAATAGVSVRTQRKLDALARKAPEQLDRVRAGLVSVHRACVEAGIVKVPTPLERVRRLLPLLSAEERQILRDEL